MALPPSLFNFVDRTKLGVQQYPFEGGQEFELMTVRYLAPPPTAPARPRHRELSESWRGRLSLLHPLPINAPSLQVWAAEITCSASAPLRVVAKIFDQASRIAEEDFVDLGALSGGWRSASALAVSEAENYCHLKELQGILIPHSYGLSCLNTEDGGKLPVLILEDLGRREVVGEGRKRMARVGFDGGEISKETSKIVEDLLRTVYTSFKSFHEAEMLGFGCGPDMPMFNIDFLQNLRLYSQKDGTERVAFLGLSRIGTVAASKQKRDTLARSAKFFRNIFSKDLGVPIFVGIALFGEDRVKWREWERGCEWFEGLSEGVGRVYDEERARVAELEDEVGGT